MAGQAYSDQMSAGLLDRQHARALRFNSICGGRTGCAFFPQMDIDLEFHSIVQRVIDDVMVDARLFFDDQKLC